MKRIALLGSTGSIGTQVLDVVGRFPRLYRLVGLAAGHNLELLAAQVREFSPGCVSVAEEEGMGALASLLGPDRPEIGWGEEGLVRVASMSDADLVVAATLGPVALAPVMAALKKGKRIALASKELLVMAGELVMREADNFSARILPIDSEASAIFQALQGHRQEDVRRIILTASGGPFWSLNDLGKRQISVEDALNHPRWEMGKKISIDSASLMNKGLEVIETHFLFGLPVEKISVHIHPESVVHSLVEYKDGSVIAQMAITDMRLPIAYALSYPERLELDLPRLDLLELKTMSFLAPDVERFPSLELAYQAARLGGSMPCVLNAANDVAVAAFLDRLLSFQDIPRLVARTMEGHSLKSMKTIADVLECDREARRFAGELVGQMGRC
jgi:1-deoxy-D-xylulose-5-phosphate reductoisomerase